MIVMQDHSYFLRWSAVYRMHVYIVDMLLGSMFTNGSGRPTRYDMDEKASFAGIRRRFIIKMFLV